MFLDGSTINFAVAFVAGLVSFFAPCLVPLMPVYVAFFAGASLEEGERRRSRTLWRIGLFSIGFLAIFVALGLGATTIGRALNVHRALFVQVMGVLLILFGAQMAQMIPVQLLPKEHRWRVNLSALQTRPLGALLLGAAFGFAWTPCIGPVLGVILLLATTLNEPLRGGALLLAFGLGIAVPFMLLGLAADRLLPLIRRTAKASEILRRVIGWVLVVFGVLLVFNLLGFISSLLLPLGTLEGVLLQWLGG